MAGHLQQEIEIMGQLLVLYAAKGRGGMNGVTTRTSMVFISQKAGAWNRTSMQLESTGYHGGIQVIR